MQVPPKEMLDHFLFRMTVIKTTEGSFNQTPYELHCLLHSTHILPREYLPVPGKHLMYYLTKEHNVLTDR